MSVLTLEMRNYRNMIEIESAYAFTLEYYPDSTFENIVAEPSQLAEGYPASPEGQAAAFRAVQDVTVSAPSTGGRGRGAVYWEPAWTAVDGAGWDPEDPAAGNAWENQAMLDFDGHLLPAPFAAFSCSVRVPSCRSRSARQSRTASSTPDGPCLQVPGRSSPVHRLLFPLLLISHRFGAVV